GAGGAGAEAAAYFGERWVGLSMAILTLLILFLSEIVPKTLGAVHWRSRAGLTARCVRLLVVSLYPLIWVSEQITRLITRG
ncbi:hemolysin, partial [Enterococcus hirae]